MNNKFVRLLSLVIDNNGKCLAFQGDEKLNERSLAPMTEAMAEVTSAFERLSVEMEILTGRSCLPQDGWIYLGPGVTAIMGNGGYRGVVLDTSDSDQMAKFSDYFGLDERPISIIRELKKEQVK